MTRRHSIKAKVKCTLPKELHTTSHQSTSTEREVPLSCFEPLVKVSLFVPTQLSLRAWTFIIQVPGLSLAFSIEVVLLPSELLHSIQVVFCQSCPQGHSEGSEPFLMLPYELFHIVVRGTKDVEQPSRTLFYIFFFKMRCALFDLFEHEPRCLMFEEQGTILVFFVWEFYSRGAFVKHSSATASYR